ncbi:uncharacterized protein C8R40DRAFT_1084234 [Lentinula edodes]|uniref:uncharacterized protein n=1 Tax=Lentinula edodes TaxID=5353 RepID=UPI001E8ECF9E|nr:uncharacterized protein C8R40DRAFT_1084234 [Lentinula edodes]KAH7880062.1 hypothetical protein C8R40DRAFT_1084234 [Lentinula edodes]
MAEALCDICYQVFSLDGFWFSTCGHGFCETCTTSLDKTRTCPTCREPRKKANIHKIYFTLPEEQENAIDVQSQAQALARSMANIHSSSTSSSIDRVVDGLKKFSGRLEVDAETASKLLGVAKDMKDRLQPIFFQLQLERDEKRNLQQKVNLWQHRVTQVEASEVEVARLKKELENAKRAKLGMVAENCRLTKRLEAEVTESEKLRKDVIDERRLTKERDELVQQLERELENAGKQAGLTNKKLKVLARSSNRMPAANSADDSLIVEPAVLECSSSVPPYGNDLDQQGSFHEMGNILEGC